MSCGRKGEAQYSHLRGIRFFSVHVFSQIAFPHTSHAHEHSLVIISTHRTCCTLSLRESLRLFFVLYFRLASCTVQRELLSVLRSAVTTAHFSPSLYVDVVWGSITNHVIHVSGDFKCSA